MVNGRAGFQHLVFTEFLGKYPPILADILSDRNGESKACLDLGCGNGEWYFFLPLSGSSLGLVSSSGS